MKHLDRRPANQRVDSRSSFPRPHESWRSILAAIGFAVHFASFAGVTTAVAQTHPVRAPFVVETNPIVPGQYTMASDGETSIIAYTELFDPGRILARTSDGRGLAGTWSIGVMSDQGQATRVLRRDSAQVVNGRAAVVWLEDVLGPNRSRLFVGRFDGATYSPPLQINDAGLPASLDIVDYAVAMRVGPNGSPYIVVVFSSRDVDTQTVVLHCVVSANGGTSFNAPFVVSSFGAVPGGVAKSVGGVAVDLKGGELHLAWTDDRHDPGNRNEVFYRRILLDWFGAPIVLPPLGSGSDVPISFVDDVVGAPVIAVDDDPTATLGYAKNVGIAWRELDKGAGLPTLRVRSSHDSGNNFQSEVVVAHTGLAGVAVGQFDLEVLGGTYVTTFEDNARDFGGGSVIVLPIGQSQAWRANSTDGLDFGVGGEGEVRMISATTDPTAFGREPLLARARGTVDAGVIAFLEENSAGIEVRTSFADQAYGAEWHLDESPQVSNAQSGVSVRDVRDVRAAYNARYSNFMICWQQETAPESGIYDLRLGGYRPQMAEIQGWKAGSPALSFSLRHLPWQDSFAFVLISAQAGANPAGQFILPDGRRTGLASDPFLQIGLSNWVLFLAQNDPVSEGAATLTIPLPPGVIAPGFPLSCVGVTWGAGGSLHVVTDFVTVSG